MRWFLPFFLIALLAACQQDGLPPVHNAGELVVLTRQGPTTYSQDETLGVVGFDHDLAQLFAKELGVKARFIVAASDAEIVQRLKKREAHLAAAWLAPLNDPELQNTQTYYQSSNLLVTHEASLPIDSLGQLAGKTVHVAADSRQAAALHELQAQLPSLNIVSESERGELDLLAEVAAQHLPAVLVDEAVFDIGSNYYPELLSSQAVGPTRPVAWLMPSANNDPELLTKANAFLARVAKDGTLARLQDRYFGHVERLDQSDIVSFLERIRTVLPEYRPHFQAAQASTGIDWRLLAALAYQESQWDPLATSPTGVRGMMMLTGETADHLGVGNRLDAKLSILAGSKYLSELRDTLPEEVREPDRLWLALAAYNLGMGHLLGARSIAKSVKADPDSWYEMKKVLPLLARPQYYQRLKSGMARGGEAVMLVENIRIYADILKRHESPHRPLAKIAGTPGKKKIIARATPSKTKKRRASAHAVKPAQFSPGRRDKVATQAAR